jgi:FkbM family methyltransferase
MELIEHSKYAKALSFSGVIKRFFLRLFRISKFDTDVNNILDKLHEKNFSIGVSNKSIFSIMTKHGESFWLRKNSSDILAFNQVIIHQEYQQLIDFVVEYSNPEKIKHVVDAGANIGFSTLFFARHFEKASICSIEPSEENISILRLNIVGELKSRVIPIQLALWFENAKIILQNDFRDKLNWSTRAIPSTSATANPIEALTLSVIKSRIGFHTIDVLKIDIEGAEGKLFESQEFLNELQNIKFLAIEIHEENADKIAIINALQYIGFTLKYRGETLFGVNVSAIEKQ